MKILPCSTKLKTSRTFLNSRPSVKRAARTAGFASSAAAPRPPQKQNPRKGCMKHLQRMKPRCARPEPSGMHETLTAYETPTCMIPRRVRFLIPALRMKILPFYEHWGAYVPKPF